MYGIHHRVGGCERTVVRKIVKHYFCNDIIATEIIHTRDLNETETVVGELRAPLSAILSTVGNVTVGALCVTQILHIKPGAVRSDKFGITYGHRVTLGDIRYGNFDPPCHILPEINHITVAKPTDTLRLKSAHDFHIGGCVATQCAIWKLGTLSLKPSGIIVAREGPVAKLKTCVIDLSVILVIAADRSLSCESPFLITVDTLLGAVSVFDNEVHTHFGITECRYLIGLIILTHGVETSVAEGHPHGISLAVAFKKPGDIIRIIQSGATVVSGSGSKHIIANFLSVDIQFVHTEAGDVDCSTPDVFICSVELFAQIT